MCSKQCLCHIWYDYVTSQDSDSPCSLLLSPLCDACPPLEGPGVPAECVDVASSWSLQDAGFWRRPERIHPSTFPIHSTKRERGLVNVQQTQIKKALRHSTTSFQKGFCSDATEEAFLVRQRTCQWSVLKLLFFSIYRTEQFFHFNDLKNLFHLLCNEKIS